MLSGSFPGHGQVLFWKGFITQESKEGVIKVVPLQKMAEKHGFTHAPSKNGRKKHGFTHTPSRNGRKTWFQPYARKKHDASDQKSVENHGDESLCLDVYGYSFRDFLLHRFFFKGRQLLKFKNDFSERIYLHKVDQLSKNFLIED